MQMGDAFPAIGAIVDDDAVTVIEILRLGQLCGNEQQVSKEWLVFCKSFREAWERLFRNDEDVYRCLRVDVADREGEIVLMDDLGGDFLIQDIFEKGNLAHQLAGVGITCLPRAHP